MVHQQQLIVLVFIGLLSLGFSAPPSSLRLVSVVYRHGDRSPSEIYPKDINKEYWVDGTGWLTNIGKQQEYALGQYIKQRYDGFIDTTRYNHTQIRVESSAKDRCLMSAYANLAALFVPEGDQIWDADLIWQPVPVKSKAPANDPKLYQGASCKKIDTLYAEVLKSERVTKVTEENKDFIAMIKENTGIEKLSIANMWEVADVLNCEKAHNLEMNEWARAPGVYERVVGLGRLSLDIWYDTPALARLTGGVLLKELIENMERATNTTPVPKFYMYSAHDSTIASVLSAMKVWQSQWMNYASMLMVELHQVGDTNEIRLLFRNDTAMDPYSLVPPGCGTPCTLEKFAEVTKDNVPVNWEKECADGATALTSCLLVQCLAALFIHLFNRFG